ncbi:ISKra4 family transposase [Variovorax sp. J22R133]|uniref:ISKra4 family transposase n=1 Tax=Variovorax brevis TaxID=3053503 RepID=UPI002574E8E3|nr:ISKra4 family transposase [Variovorax sp. J22R133]MDM0118013.1 ISKra4 family transposase [Variovorax sp. J22R133]
MRVTVQVCIERAGSRPVTLPLHSIDRPCEQVQDVGLALGDAKTILGKLQQTLVQEQLDSYLSDRRACPHCLRPRAIKGYHPLRFRTAFGDIDLRSPRWRRCRCEQFREATFCPLSELLTVHTSPELAYLEAKWAAQVSFAAVRALLQEVLPIEHGLHEETIRQHVRATAERLEAQLGPEQFAYDGGSQREIEASPEPAAPITVGLDGGYIRGRERLPGANGCFEVIAGKSIPEEGAAKVFAFVHRIDRKPKRRLRAVLESQGILPRQHITFLCDGGDTVRELGAFVHPRSEHILDWFHVAMRIEQLLQTTRGLQGPAKEDLLKGIERVKWFLWHGNVIRAEETLYDLLEEIDGMREQDRQAGRPPSIALKKLDRALEEFATYVDNNAGAIVNYGERYRCGERISTGFVESAVNQVIAKRFVKKQQMRWTPRGAHLLLQVRTQVLNGELRAAFQGWYPRFGAPAQPPLAA